MNGDNVVQVKGALYKLLDIREVGQRGWKVRDMVLKVHSQKGDQFRLLQVSGSLLNEVSRIPHGAEIMCEVVMLGKEVTHKVTLEIKYRNLDEVLRIHRI